MTGRDPRRGMAVGDVLVFLSLLALAFSLAYPRIGRARLRDEVEQAVIRVQAAVGAAEQFQGDRGTWPEPADEGTTPTDLAPYLPGGFSFAGEGYRLKLDIWETAKTAPPVELPEGPPSREFAALPDTIQAQPEVLFGSLASVSVVSEDPRVLAGLLDHFGADRSFVHADRWTMVFASEPGH